MQPHITLQVYGTHIIDSFCKPENASSQTVHVSDRLIDSFRIIGYSVSFYPIIPDILPSGIEPHPVGLSLILTAGDTKFESIQAVRFQSVGSRLAAVGSYFRPGCCPCISPIRRLKQFYGSGIVRRSPRQRGIRIFLFGTISKITQRGTDKVGNGGYAFQIRYSDGAL